MMKLMAKPYAERMVSTLSEARMKIINFFKGEINMEKEIPFKQ